MEVGNLLELHGDAGRLHSRTEGVIALKLRRDINLAIGAAGLLDVAKQPLVGRNTC